MPTSPAALFIETARQALELEARDERAFALARLEVIYETAPLAVCEAGRPWLIALRRSLRTDE